MLSDPEANERDAVRERGTYFLASSMAQCEQAFKVLLIFRSIEDAMKRRRELNLEGKAKIFLQVFLEAPEISQGSRIREASTESIDGGSKEKN